MPSRVLPRPPIPVCDEDNSGSFCMPSVVTGVQAASLKRSQFCVYYKVDGKLQKLNTVRSTTAYLYVSPQDSRKLTAKECGILYVDGVKELHIYKQSEGKLKCKYVKTKEILRPESKTKHDYSIVIWVVLALILIFVVYSVISSMAVVKEQVVADEILW
jgi:predicted nucleic acid-binding Zn ribbon protein